MLSDSASSLAVQVKSSALITLSIYTPIHIGNLKHKRIKMHRSLVFVSQVILGLQTFLRMCGLPVLVSCRANAEYMSPSGEQPNSLLNSHSFYESYLMLEGWW